MICLFIFKDFKSTMANTMAYALGFSDIDINLRRLLYSVTLQIGLFHFLDYLNLIFFTMNTKPKLHWIWGTFINHVVNFSDILNPLPLSGHIY